jgi:hypothetical protein
MSAAIGREHGAAEDACNSDCFGLLLAHVHPGLLSLLHPPWRAPVDLGSKSAEVSPKPAPQLLLPWAFSFFTR